MRDWQYLYTCTAFTILSRENNRARSIFHALLPPGARPEPKDRNN